MSLEFSSSSMNLFEIALNPLRIDISPELLIFQNSQLNSLKEILCVLRLACDDFVFFEKIETQTGSSSPSTLALGGLVNNSLLVSQ